MVGASAAATAGCAGFCCATQDHHRRRHPHFPSQYSLVLWPAFAMQTNQSPIAPPPPAPRIMAAHTLKAKVASEDKGRGAEVKELWELFFSDPSQWWDKRSDKKNARSPDFKHKITHKALWIDSRLNPPWVVARLGASIQCQEQERPDFSTHEISARVARREQLWQEFFSDPSQWWDNRICKKGPKYPDFEHKSTHEGLWIEAWQNPRWVKVKMDTLVMDRSQFGGRLRSRVPSSFGDVVSNLCREGRLKEAVHMLEAAVQQNAKIPSRVFAGLLKGCAKRKSLIEGKQVHTLIVQSGHDSEIFLGNILVDMYAKCGSIVDARKVFNTMPELNLFSWTAIISAYTNAGQCEEAIELFQQMQLTGVAPDEVAYAVALKACTMMAVLEPGKQLHSQIIENGIEVNVFVGSALVDMYANCGSIECAREVFDNMHDRDVVMWNAMIGAYSHAGNGNEALCLYEKMKQQGFQPNDVTYVVLLKACASIAALDRGKQIHSHILRSSFKTCIALGNGLVDMYAKCGDIENARRVFDNMNAHSMVSWTVMIGAYARQGLGYAALTLYDQMKQEHVHIDDVTYVVILKACTSIAALEQGKQVHSDIIRSGYGSDVTVANTLVDMYAKCGCTKDARRVFDRMHEQNVVSWNSMIGGYAHQGLGEEALALYKQMTKEGVQPDEVTYVVLLKACANISALEEGKEIHRRITKSPHKSNVTVGSALVDMYAKCGCIEHACRVFNSLHEQNVVSWNAMIAGYAHQGLGKEALGIFEKMLREGTKPNEATYTSVLSACSHSGLVDEGRHLFDSMLKNHDVTPTLDHYACMVDLLGRAGCVAEAEDFVKKMPFQPDAVVWRALLGAAKNHGYMEIGSQAFDHILKLEPENAATYVLLSNLYALAGGKAEGSKIKNGGGRYEKNS